MIRAAAESFVDLFDYAEQAKSFVPCPICAIDNPSQPDTDRYGYAIGLSHCKRCGLVYLNPRMSAEQYVAFYQTAYRPIVDWYSQSDTASPRNQERSQRRGGYIGDALKAAGGSVKSLLDVGGGTGVTSRAVADVLGCSSVTIVDPNAAELQVAATHGCAGIMGTPETLPLPTTQYDLVLTTQTTDHWLEPLTALRWMRAACRPRGHLWIDIIDVPELVKEWPLRCHWKIDHPLYWSAKTMCRALARTGWRVCQSYVMRRDGTPVLKRPAFLCEGV